VSVFWIHASSEERFRLSYASIAQECDIPDRDNPEAELLALVKTWLENEFKGRWLMVVDNADDTQLFFGKQQETPSLPHGRLSRYIPECAHGSILVTTRNKQAGSRFARGKLPIEVGTMTNREANELIRTMLENDDIPDDEVLGLATRLEALPLALAQAAAFIHENGITINDYIKLLDKSDVALIDCLSESFETVGRDSDTPHTVTATWIISFEQIEQQDRFTGEILSLISLFDRQAIPKSFIIDYWQKERAPGAGEPSQELKISKAIGTLKAFYFISEVNSQSLDMHRLVQLVARKWLIIKGKMTEFAQHALKTVSDAYPFGRFETREVCLKYLPHAYAVLKHNDTSSREGQIVRAQLLHNMTGYFHYEGRWKEAEKLQVDVVEIRKTVLGNAHPHTLSSMGNLASTYSNQGRWKEAEDLNMDVIETRKKVLGYEHPSTLISMNNLALAYLDQCRWKEAEELQVDVIEIRKRVLGDRHPSTLIAMGSLASTYRNQGRWKEAEKLNMDVMEIMKRVLGDKHPSTLMVINNLALTYSDQGRWKEAEELLVDVMEIMKRVLGDEHPSTLISMNNLASTYSDQGRWKEAEELQVDVMEIRKRVLGDRHPSTLRSIGNLSLTYRNQGRSKEAEELEEIRWK
jgi:tetratricopeptide (TPR) repeat protein